MKIKKTVRLSKNAIDILEEQKNQSQFLENLITGNSNTPESDIIKRIQTMEQRILDCLSTENKQPVDKKYSLSSPTARTKQDVLQDIEQEKQVLQQLLEVNQDPTDHAKQQSILQELWEEYHLLVKEEKKYEDIMDEHA